MKTKFDFKTMGGPATIEAVGQKELINKAYLACINEASRLEEKYSRFNPKSALSVLNQNAARKSGHRIDSETYHLLDFCNLMWRVSSGYFDPTTGVLRKIWDFEKRTVPPTSKISSTLNYVGWQNIKVTKNKVYFKKPGIELDFGGLVKEYAVDRLVHILTSSGVKAGYVNLAGDVGIVKSKTPIVVGIKSPRGQTQEAIHNIEIRSGAIATSGDYARYFIQNGRRYCHIFNPFTGMPCAVHRSVTVAGPNCLLAGAIATLCMIAPKAEADAILANQNLSKLVKVWVV